ncbi:MAG: WecB/TagA/CpsF family glycosyltransferase, partial [Chloroflexota bacterium]|nr:WecB/TagA/CpsF family glycosyltransferase [Chloroflexota bacterium]
MDPLPPSSVPQSTGTPETARVTVLGARVDMLDERDVHARLRTALGDPWDGCCRHVATLNPEYVIAARRDPHFAAALARADVVTADGIGVAVAARLHGAGLWSCFPARVTGVTVAEWLAAESCAGSPLFLLGGGEGVAEAATVTLQSRFPGAVVAGTWAGGTSRPQDDAEALRRITESGARSLLVAYGAAGQVLWINRNRAALALAGVRVAVGVGGAMDFLAGRVPRAPELLQRLGLEWLYRLLRQPWR